MFGIKSQITPQVFIKPLYFQLYLLMALLGQELDFMMGINPLEIVWILRNRQNIHQMDLDFIWAADDLEPTHKHFIKACNFPESTKRSKKKKI